MTCLADPTHLYPRTEFDGRRLLMEHAVGGGRQFGEWLGDLGLLVFLDSILVQACSERRCTLLTVYDGTASIRLSLRHSRTRQLTHRLHLH